MPEPATGCLICAAELTYLPAAERMKCALCGAQRDTAARCQQGHFVCDACHAAGAREIIEATCVATESRDPIEIALRLMAHPSVKMHGPEHHFLVPAALLAAYYNARGEPKRKAAAIREAKKRAEPVLGGFCGFQGACGSAVGTGIFVSLATGSTPLAREAWGLANRMTSRSLEAVGKLGGPRCCKRVAWLSILQAVKFARAHLGTELKAKGPKCGFTDRNKECLERGCPFHRSAA